MSDDRTGTNSPDPGVEDDHDYHSQLEVDDSSGWRVFIVPVALLLFVVGGLLFIFLYQGDDSGPDPRIANRFAPAAPAPAAEPGPPTIPVQVEDQRGQTGEAMPDDMGEPIMQNMATDRQPVQ